MKIKNITHKTSKQDVTVLDCFVDDGYVKGGAVSLPDIDTDFMSTRRQDVKEYIENRYNKNGKQRVFSAGTFTTLKAKAVMKDVARVMRISPKQANYLTAMFSDSEVDYTGIFYMAAVNRRVSKFVKQYPQLFEDIRTLMFQPRSSSIHASAVLVTPDTKDGKDAECFDFAPIKKIDGMLVSENSGYDLDEMGMLKNDILTTNELTKIHSILKLIEKHYGKKITMEEIVLGDMDDTGVYTLLQGGYTQDIFQFSSNGITKFLKQMKPKVIGDLIAANALYRPATLENGAVDAFLDCRNGYVAPTFLWGTHEILKDTYGQMIYQEQMVQIARKVGGFSLAEGVKLVKFISKKKIDKIKEMKDKFMNGSKAKGCPDDDAVKIWDMIESGGSYLFNKSHATAYSAISYVSTWLKANYPTAFYTVALEWADDKSMSNLMREMESCSTAKVVVPDINKSIGKFHTDYKTDSIFWSLSSIKMVGLKAVNWILEEREKHGDFTDIENFIARIFKYKFHNTRYYDNPDDENEGDGVRCPVNSRHVQNLILSGCFDKVQRARSSVERYAILKTASDFLGFKLNDKEYPEDMIDKHYFWSQQQIKVSGLGSVDYQRVYQNDATIKESIRGRASYKNFEDILSPEMEGKNIAFCATVVEVSEGKFTSSKTGEVQVFGKVILQQNNEMNELVIWPTEYAAVRGIIYTSKDKVVAGMAKVKYNDFKSHNTLQLTRNRYIEVI